MPSFWIPNRGFAAHPGSPHLWRSVVAALAATTWLLSIASSVEARPRRAKGRSSRPAAKSSVRAVSGPGAPAEAKIAVLEFEGDDTEPLRKHVIKVFADRGHKVNTTLEAQDNPTQYRDMGAALNLTVYVHGKIRDTTPDRAVATITLRSAVTGRPLVTASFNGFRRGLPFDVEEKLWDRVASAFKRACIEASRPHRRHSKPLRIEAGTPL
jgi:hypothetical protein